MKTISINIRTDRLATQEDIIYAIVNREDELQWKGYNFPEMRVKTKVKIKEGPGLWVLLTGCLP